MNELRKTEKLTLYISSSIKVSKNQSSWNVNVHSSQIYKSLLKPSPISGSFLDSTNVWPCSLRNWRRYWNCSSFFMIHVQYMFDIPLSSKSFMTLILLTFFLSTMKLESEGIIFTLGGLTTILLTLHLVAHPPFHQTLRFNINQYNHISCLMKGRWATKCCVWWRVSEAGFFANERCSFFFPIFEEDIKKLCFALCDAYLQRDNVLKWITFNSLYNLSLWRAL